MTARENSKAFTHGFRLGIAFGFIMGAVAALAIVKVL